ncbi:MAG: hypothetical protein ABSC95_31700, partial [Acetobacteraceae bacterium]
APSLKGRGRILHGSVADFFQRQSARARAEATDCDHHHKHRRTDKAKHPTGPIVLQEERDDEAGDDR